MTEAVINFRCDKATYDRAKARLSVGVVKFPDLLRLAVKAIADDDATVFNEVLKEGGKDYTGISSAWLYYKAHELFTYDEGMLYRKSNKGAGQRGAPVDLVTRGGVPCVTINGSHYPVKDIIWLMFYGHVSGDVVCIEGEDLKISNLMLSNEGQTIQKICHHITPYERDLIKCGKLRALLVDTEGITKADANNIELLCNTGHVFYLTLYDGTGWKATRSALHAQRIGAKKYLISIS
ncbi:hypothetical protein LXD80_13610 [Enterobacter sp. ASE]|uniref:hypothetical protein n=1 Tax=Enterobacter sp. ASE TaxID=2905968 RepID=UPI001E3E8960|nr:hypothetical protein [Enterobacter sp. ASE]MCE3116830.1 hypothetical protein [Enterobacter sp. ASE]